MLYNLHFSPSKCCLFHNATLSGFCITHILNTGVLKFEKNSVAKRLNAGKKKVNEKGEKYLFLPLIRRLFSSSYSSH